MAFLAKALADGRLPNAKGTLYTCPAATKTYVKFMSLHNTSGGAEAVTIYVNMTGTSRVVYTNATLAAGAGVRPLATTSNETLILQAGDLIEGVSTTAAVTDYVICGVEES